MALRSLGFLHTSQTHVARFDELLAKLAPDVQALHRVDEALLERARERGATHPDVVEPTRRALAGVAAAGARVVVCTCSTLGAIAEDMDAGGAGFRALRIDRAMADGATRNGGRLQVLATLESSLEPTRALLEDSARAGSCAVSIRCTVVAGAWARFEAGECDAFHAVVEEAVREAAPRADAIVLAQASMAACAERCADLDVPIWSSPRPGLQAALALLPPPGVRRS